MKSFSGNKVVVVGLQYFNALDFFDSIVWNLLFCGVAVKTRNCRTTSR